MYYDLLKRHFVQAKTVSLPLAGDVTIRIFQNTPFPPDEDLFSIIEDTAHITEESLGIPFPTDEIILLVVDLSFLPVIYPESYYGRVRAHNKEAGYIDISVHEDSHMRVSRREGRAATIPHETSHYYFNYRLRPQWLREGAASFVETYYNHLNGTQDLSDRLLEIADVVETQCFEIAEMENIRHVTYLYGDSLIPPPCIYAMGEHFIISIAELVGGAVVLDALGEMYTFGFVDERTAYFTLFEHVPHNERKRFRDLYRKLHGSDYAFPGTDRSDDHSDEAVGATLISVGDIVEGNLDYMFDFDYFVFRAERGQNYRLLVNHDTLRASSVNLFSSDGRKIETWWSRMRMSAGPQILWTAPNSGDYYFAVQNFGGKRGAYALSVTPAK